jgi:hypothetical protein
MIFTGGKGGRTFDGVARGVNHVSKIPDNTVGTYFGVHGMTRSYGASAKNGKRWSVLTIFLKRKGTLGISVGNAD